MVQSVPDTHAQLASKVKAFGTIDFPFEGSGDVVHIDELGYDEDPEIGYCGGWELFSFFFWEKYQGRETNEGRCG
jgi:hypothetical protein